MATVPKKLTKHDLAAMSRNEIVQHLANDPILFGQTVIPHHMGDATPQFHHSIIDLLQKNYKFTAVVAPRGHAKSTLVNMIWLLYRMVYRMETVILQISESLDQSKNFLEAIKVEIEENETLKYLYGNLKSDDKWASEDVRLANGVYLSAKGSGQRVRGIKRGAHRPSLILMDDFESEQNTITEENRMRLKRWVDGAVMPSLDVNGRLVMVGTIVHEDSYLSDVMKTNRGWAKQFYQALDKDGNPLWPQRFDKSYLMSIKKNFEDRHMVDMFYQEYMNVPFSPSSAPLAGMLPFDEWSYDKASGRLTVDGEDIGPVLLFRGLDPSTGKLRGDYTADCLIARDAQNETWILKCDLLKIKPHEIISRIFTLHEIYEPAHLVIESTAFQEMIATETRIRMIEENHFVPIIEEKPRTSKSSRLLALEPRIRAGKVHCHSALHGFMMQAKSWRPDREIKNDDGLDAYYYAEKFARQSVDTGIPAQDDSVRKDSNVVNWMVA